MTTKEQKTKPASQSLDSMQQWARVQVSITANLARAPLSLSNQPSFPLREDGPSEPYRQWSDSDNRLSTAAPTLSGYSGSADDLGLLDVNFSAVPDEPLSPLLASVKDYDKDYTADARLSNSPSRERDVEPGTSVLAHGERGNPSLAPDLNMNQFFVNIGANMGANIGATLAPYSRASPSIVGAATPSLPESQSLKVASQRTEQPAQLAPATTSAETTLSGRLPSPAMSCDSGCSGDAEVEKQFPHPTDSPAQRKSTRTGAVPHKARKAPPALTIPETALEMKVWEDEPADTRRKPQKRQKKVSKVTMTIPSPENSSRSSPPSSPEQHSAPTPMSASSPSSNSSAPDCDLCDNCCQTNQECSGECTCQVCLQVTTDLSSLRRTHEDEDRVQQEWRTFKATLGTESAQCQIDYIDRMFKFRDIKAARKYLGSHFQEHLQRKDYVVRAISSKHDIIQVALGEPTFPLYKFLNFKKTESARVHCSISVRKAKGVPVPPRRSRASLVSSPELSSFAINKPKLKRKRARTSTNGSSDDNDSDYVPGQCD